MKVKIIKLDEADEQALACMYRNQNEPQPCYVQLDTRDGEMTADYNGEIGTAVPMNVWKGIVRRFPIQLMTSSKANALMEAIAPQVQELLDELGEDGDWSEKADQTEEGIESVCEEEEGDIEYGDGCDYIYDCRDEVRTRIKNGETVEDIASCYSEEAWNVDGMHYILDNIEYAVQSVKDDMEEEEEEEKLNGDGDHFTLGGIEYSISSVIDDLEKKEN